MIEVLRERLRPYYLKKLFFRLRKQNRPRQFEECWNYPIYQIGELNGCAGAAASGKPDVLFLPMADWHTCMQRTQHLAVAFAEAGHRCFYVNPHLGREFPKTYLESPRVQIGHILPNVWEIHVHLRHEPVFHARQLREDEERTVCDAVRDVLRKMNVGRLLICVSFPLWSRVASRLRRDFQANVIYDCHDLLSGFRAVAPEVLALESSLFDESEMIAFSSQWLLDHKVAGNHQLAEKSCVIRNGVTLSDFDRPDQPPQSPAPGRPVEVIYVGALESWFDTALLAKAARAYPEWTFNLIGVVGAARIAALGKLPNVRLPGYVPYRDLARHLSNARVAIIPFKLTDLTMAVNPIKLYEYFALGLPVVSVRLPEVEQFAEIAYIANSAQEFVTLLGEAAKESDPDLRRRRRLVAKKESWAARRDELLQELGKIGFRDAHAT